MFKDFYCGLNPQRDWRSRRATLWHNLGLIFQTIVCAAAITALWAYCYSRKWPMHAHHETDLIMLNTSILVCAAIFAIVAALLFTEAWQKISKLSRAVLLGDECEFMLLRDEKVSIMMHVVLGFFALSVLVQFGLAGYTSTGFGAVIVFLISSCFVVYFIAILEMQNPHKIVWIRTHAPPHWLTQNSQDYFQKYREHRPKDSLCNGAAVS